MLRNFGWVITDRLAGMAWPHVGSAEALCGLGVGSVVTLTEEPPPAELARAGLRVHHEPIRDFAAPSVEALKRTIAFLTAELEAGRSAVVHCHAGIGRTGTVLAAYLVSTGVPAAEAIEQVRRLRPGSLETDTQEHAVFAFARELGRGEERP